MKHTILIVDDEEIMRDIIEGSLAGRGYNLAFAANGAEALAKASELTPDLILLDVMMPDMNGFEVCRHLREDPRLAEVPVIIITALGDRESRLRGINAGADDFLNKPFDIVELQARVQTITRLNRYRRLLTERNKFERVVNQAKDGYLMLSQNDHILYANPQARLYLGLSTDNQEPVSGTFLDWARKQYRCEPAVTWATWPQPLTEESPRYLVRPESSTAVSSWLQADHLMEISSQEYLVRLHDITATVMNQRLMWSFHEQVSHKLRTPLAKLTGFLRVLKEDKATLSDADKDVIINTADKSAQQLQEEILSVFEYMDLLDKTKPGQAHCSLTKILKIITQVKSDLKIDTIDVSYKNNAAGDNIYMPISCQVMELILWETLQNAQKFHPKGSPVIEIVVSCIANEVHIQISDDGLTLAPDQLEKMWVPYYQAEKGFSGQVPGMGLGLSVVASLIWDVDGTCRSYNRENEPGIVVELTLPLACKAA